MMTLALLLYAVFNYHAIFVVPEWAWVIAVAGDVWGAIVGTMTTIYIYDKIRRNR